MKIQLIARLVILSAIVSFGGYNSFAKDSTIKKYNPEGLYLELGLSKNISNRSIPYYNASIYGINKYGYGVSANIQQTNRISKDKPDDFHHSGFFFDRGTWAAADKLSITNVRALKSFQLNKKVRMVMEIGLSHNTYKEAYFIPKVPGSFLSFNWRSHDVHYNTYKLWGLSSKAKVDFQFRRGFGLSTGFTGNINKEFSYLSFDVSLLFGYVSAK